MGPLVEGILGLLMWLRRAVGVAILGFVLLMVWLAVRRAGRKGLELAVLLFGAALLSFTAAVFAPRQIFSETVAVTLALLAAVLLVAAVATVIWFAVRRRRPPAVIEHTRPPWEDGGW